MMKMKSLLSGLFVFILMVSILSGTADAEQITFYPNSDVPMLENMSSIEYYDMQTEYEANTTVYKFLYKWYGAYSTIISSYEGYLANNGFIATDSGLTKENYSVEIKQVTTYNNEYLLVTVKAGLTDDELLFDAVNYTAGKNIRVYVDNMELQFTTPPQNMNGTVLVPFRAIMEALGLTVSWDSEKRIAIGKNDQYEIAIPIGSATATVNGEEKTLQVPAQLMDSTTMIPVRFISESVGCNVVWVDQGKDILISEKSIIEWRFGGHDTEYPYQNFTCMYVNGVKTEGLRYLGTYWDGEADYKSKCKSISYNELLRKPLFYENSDVYFRGFVVDVINSDSSTVLIVQVTRQNFGYTDSIYVTLPQTSEFLENDIIDLYGKSLRTATYIGATVPCVSARYVDLVDLTDRKSVV